MTEAGSMTVAFLTDFAQRSVGDDDSLKQWARAYWQELGMPSDPAVEVEPSQAAQFMSGLSAEQRRRTSADTTATADEADDPAMHMDEARARLIDACGGDTVLAEQLMTSHVLPRSSYGLVRSSVVRTLVSQTALAAVDRTQTPTAPPVNAIRDYDHVTVTTAASSVEPMMARYQLALDYPGAGREPTGFTNFDNEVYLKPSSVTIVAGREGAGKSAFLLQAAATMSVRGPVIYVITEMSQEDVWKRLTACFGQIEKRKLENPTTESMDAARTTHEWMAANMSLHVIDAVGVPLHDYREGRKDQPGLLTIISDLSASLGGVRAVFIDNLWGVAHANKDMSRGMSTSLALGSITKTLREYSGSTQWDCPVILAHHLNREGAPTTLAKNADSTGTSAPATENLGGSDQIGFDAEAVVILSKQPKENPDFDEQAHAEGNVAKAYGDYVEVLLLVAKNRNGEPNKVMRTHFYGAQQRFVEAGAFEAPPMTVQVNRDTRLADAARAARHDLPPL